MNETTCRLTLKVHKTNLRNYSDSLKHDVMNLSELEVFLNPQSRQEKRGSRARGQPQLCAYWHRFAGMRRTHTHTHTHTHNKL